MQEQPAYQPTFPPCVPCDHGLGLMSCMYEKQRAQFIHRVPPTPRPQPTCKQRRAQQRNAAHCLQRHRRHRGRGLTGDQQRLCSRRHLSQLPLSFLRSAWRPRSRPCSRRCSGVPVFSALGLALASPGTRPAPAFGACFGSCPCCCCCWGGGGGAVEEERMNCCRGPACRAQRSRNAQPPELRNQGLERQP